jgi:magnesium chelatase family protein
MELSTVLSRAQRGVDAPLVQVETHISNGLPAFNIVGLPTAAVRESKERVRSALLNSHFEWPARRLTVNLAPADLPKDGGRFDLPIALGILAASGQIPADSLSGREFVWELALDGRLRDVSGSVAASIAATRDTRILVLPEASACSAAVVPGARVIGSVNLLRLCAWLQGRHDPGYARPDLSGEPPAYPDLADVQGQHLARRALEVAAAGGHNLLLVGPPGTGKTLLATRLRGILPEPTEAEVLDIMAMQSAFAAPQGQPPRPARPFRAPHHTASARALVGGGSCPRPGEISLAHRGVLFLDELPEFPRGVLEVLREPLESGQITISRALQQVTFPAHFQLIAAMNPCPCGFDGDPQRACRCTPDQVQRYRSRLSGPLLDRIDMRVHLRRPATASLIEQIAAAESSESVRERVTAARERAMARQGVINAVLERQALYRVCQLDTADRIRLEQAATRLGLSMRACLRVLRVARTIADLASGGRVEAAHLSEALGYRQSTPETPYSSSESSDSRRLS